MKLHLISLEQDSERVQEEMSQFEYNMDSKDYQSLEIEDISLNGQITATRHLMSVATDIMNNSNERVYG
jgi:vesicle coat complex subunit